MHLSGSPRSPAARPRAAAFTLVEIMIVVGLLALLAAWGAPMMLRTLQKDAFRQSISDVMEGCSHARARAILHGAPTELVIRAQDGQLTVQPVKLTRQQTEFLAGANAPAAASTGRPAFNARLHEDVSVELLDVNGLDMMGAEEAHVRFYPNGTCDEFTMILKSPANELRKITLEIVTGLADVETIDVFR